MLTSQIEQTEQRRRNSQNASDEKIAEQMIAQLQSSPEIFAGETQQCLVEQVEAELNIKASKLK